MRSITVFKSNKTQCSGIESGSRVVIGIGILTRVGTGTGSVLNFKIWLGPDQDLVAIPNVCELFFVKNY